VLLSVLRWRADGLICGPRPTRSCC
jgi:hypothetical protein